MAIKHPGNFAIVVVIGKIDVDVVEEVASDVELVVVVVVTI